MKFNLLFSFFNLPTLCRRAPFRPLSSGGWAAFQSGHLDGVKPKVMKEEPSSEPALKCLLRPQRDTWALLFK